MSQGFKRSSEWRTNSPALWVDPYHTVLWVDLYWLLMKVWLTFIKDTYGSFLYFPNISSKFWLSGNTVWSILSFQGAYIYFVFSRIKYKFPPEAQICSNCIRDNTVWPKLSFWGSYRNFHLSSDIFKCSNGFKKLYLVHYGLTYIALPKILYKFPLKVHIFWSSKIYSKNCIRGNMVWPILSFQGSYKCSPNSHISFGVKNLLKNCIRDRNLRNLNHGQFSLNYIVHLENINQFLSKAQIANSDQDQIWFEPYCSFRDST